MSGIGVNPDFAEDEADAVVFRAQRERGGVVTDIKDIAPVLRAMIAALDKPSVGRLRDWMRNAVALFSSRSSLRQVVNESEC